MELIGIVGMSKLAKRRKGERKREQNGDSSVGASVPPLNFRTVKTLGPLKLLDR